MNIVLAFAATIIMGRVGSWFSSPAFPELGPVLSIATMGGFILYELRKLLEQLRGSQEVQRCQAEQKCSLLAAFIMSDLQSMFDRLKGSHGRDTTQGPRRDS